VRFAYRIIPGAIISRIPFIIGTQLAAMVVHIKIHGRLTMIASTTSAIISALAHTGHTSVETV
jgi:hypothetical protein